MLLSHGDGQRSIGSPAKDWIFRTVQGEVNAHFAAAFRTLELQIATAFAELICDDPLAVIAAGSDLWGLNGRPG